jgi:hypothetical protein
MAPSNAVDKFRVQESRKQWILVLVLYKASYRHKSNVRLKTSNLILENLLKIQKIAKHRN